ncbi:MAG TPA: glyoxalase/bleomycin resistance/dioxygenase family protein, partial [Rhodospirillaceae bacterium]|nr:glyoxalase/bleomycin resistance/dioxygenase family protein [Rhodospirillaceae bacterium]
AKWMLDDPRVNFAISPGKANFGVDHLGVQVESGEELTDYAEKPEAAGRNVIEQEDAVCCYARSDKAWVSDPQGVPWETFLSHGAEAVYGGDRVKRSSLASDNEGNSDRPEDEDCCTGAVPTEIECCGGTRSDETNCCSG